MLKLFLKAISYLERTKSFIQGANNHPEYSLIPKTCFFTWDHRSSLLLYSSSRASIFLLNFYIFSLQGCSLYKVCQQRPAQEVTEIGSTVGETFLPM